MYDRPTLTDLISDEYPTDEREAEDRLATVSARSLAVVNPWGDA